MGTEQRYAPGSRVLVRGQEWLVKSVQTNTLGVEALHCTGVSQLVRDRPAVFLTDLDTIELIDPAQTRFVQDASPNYRHTRLYLESQLRSRTHTGSTLYMGHRAAMDTMPFQYEPANQALGQLRQRILIADTTGLGKTLEAGILMSELIARGKGRRILVVTSKAMLEQFQKELWDRFTIPLIKLDSAKIAQVRAKLPANANPFNYYDKVIVSVDTLKRDVEYGVHLESSYWDIIVIDEAQNVAPRGGTTSQRAKLAKKLADRSDTLIMLSATPHDGTARSFASLMKMLDPTAIADENHYGPEDIQGLFVRRFKKDVRGQVEGEFLERDVQMVKNRASPAEERAFDIFADLDLAMDAGKRTTASRRAGGEKLFKTTVEKALFSSPAACADTIRNCLKRLEEKDPNDRSGDAAQLEALLEAVNRIDAAGFSRYQGLLRLLRSREYGWNPRDPEDRVVIFTERIATMNWVAEHLKQDLHLREGAIRTMYGGMTDVEQQKIVAEFANRESPIRVLVASDVASEGINLHYFCHRLIHFDTPWSLMVFQQRNGRIDRYGQTRRPLIRFLEVEAANERIKGDARILEILIEKEKQAYENIGDPAMLMGKYDVDAEEGVVREAIETEGGAKKLERTLEANGLSPMEQLLRQGQQPGGAKGAPRAKTEPTLMDDEEYLKLGLQEFGRDAGVQGTPEGDPKADGERIWLDYEGELACRLKRVMPGSVHREDDRNGAADASIVLCSNKQHCMVEMEKARHGAGNEPGAWPQAQYLWPLHPIFDWLDDKTSTLLFGREDAPLLSCDTLSPESLLYLVSGTVPNKKAAPMVEEWYGVIFEGGAAATPQVLTLKQVERMTRIERFDLPNRLDVDEAACSRAHDLCPRAVEAARAELARACERYSKETAPRIDEELDKLADLEERHKEVERRRTSLEGVRLGRERRIDELFGSYTDWVAETLEIEDEPIIRVWAAWTGVAR